MGAFLCFNFPLEEYSDPRSEGGGLIYPLLEPPCVPPYQGEIICSSPDKGRSGGVGEDLGEVHPPRLLITKSTPACQLAGRPQGGE